MWMTSYTRSARSKDLGDFEKKSVSWVVSCLGRSRLTFACSRRPWSGVTRMVESRWKSQNRKNVYLSPYVEEPLNSKGIKRFVPELRSRKCFSCFEIPMFYVYIYEYSVSISYIRIWLRYKNSDRLYRSVRRQEIKSFTWIAEERLKHNILFGRVAVAHTELSYSTNKDIRRATSEECQHHLQNESRCRRITTWQNGFVRITGCLDSKGWYFEK